MKIYYEETPSHHTGEKVKFTVHHKGLTPKEKQIINDGLEMILKKLKDVE